MALEVATLTEVLVKRWHLRVKSVDKKHVLARHPNLEGGIMRFTKDQIQDLAYKIKFFGVYSGDTKYLGKPEYAARYIVGGVASWDMSLDLVRGTPLLEIERVLEELLDGAGSLGYDFETIGFWVDESTLSIEVDLGDSWYTEERARHVAAQRNQKAIYDRIKDEVIYV